MGEGDVRGIEFVGDGEFVGGVGIGEEETHRGGGEFGEIGKVGEIEGFEFRSVGQDPAGYLEAIFEGNGWEDGVGLEVVKFRSSLSGEKE